MGQDMAEGDYLGKGMKFPPQVNRVTGRFITAEGKESVKESVYIILMTQRTERWLRPEFGSDLTTYTFMDTDYTMLHIMGRDLKNQIMSQEPRISELSIDMNPDIKEGCLIVTIDYVIAEDNTEDNLIFPFYLNVAMEGEENEIEDGIPTR